MEESEPTAASHYARVRGAILEGRPTWWEKVKGKGVLLTWMLPAGLIVATPVIGGEEPTALRDVVRLLRASAEVQSTWKDLLLHAHVCKRLAGGSDVAVCLEICPDTWQERKQLMLHVPAFIKFTRRHARRSYPAADRGCSGPLAVSS